MSETSEPKMTWPFKTKRPHSVVEVTKEQREEFCAGYRPGSETVSEEDNKVVQEIAVEIAQSVVDKLVALRKSYNPDCSGDWEDGLTFLLEGDAILEPIEGVIREILLAEGIFVPTAEGQQHLKAVVRSLHSPPKG